MKSKKILTILLSLAIMFTFMPAMAFAAAAPANEGSWDLTKREVTVNGQTYSGVTVQFVESTGLTVASCPVGGVIENYSFYDLDSAQIAAIGSTTVEGVSNFDFATYAGMNEQTTVTLRFYAPSYADNYVAGSSNPKSTHAFLPDGWAALSKVSDLTASGETQDGEISASFTFPVNASFVGALKAKPVKVQGNTTGGFVRDDKTGSAANVQNGKIGDYQNGDTVTYTGKTINVTALPVAGCTVSYEKYNTSNGAWEAINGNGIALKDVKDSGNYRALYTKNGVSTSIGLLVDIGPFWGGADEFEFDMTALQNLNYRVLDSVSPSSFIVTGDVLAADREAAMKYFDEAYEIKATQNAGDASIVTWKIAEKSGVTAKELYKNNKDFCDNYDITSATKMGADDSSVTVRVYSASNDKEDDISFSGQTSYTYSGKKTTKAGKLKAKKVITVKATADSGNTVTYVATKTAGGKITVSADGKITLKKGLKKGTYKVTIKAKTAAGFGYKAASEKQTYVFKIKK